MHVGLTQIRILLPPAESQSLGRIRVRGSRTPTFRAGVGCQRSRRWPPASTELTSQSNRRHPLATSSRAALRGGSVNSCTRSSMRRKAQVAEATHDLREAVLWADDRSAELARWMLAPR
jgi:hypothetical protein